MWRDAECPECNSHPRHRAFFLWLSREYGLSQREGIALVFAPERPLAAIWENAPGLKIIRTDIEHSRGVNLLADIQRLPFATDTFDLVWCHHVLTQVPDDRIAISELHRILRPETGELIVSAAQAPGTRTREFGGPNNRFMGFWRLYGDDFPERLAEGGLDVCPAQYRVSEEDCRRYGLVSDEVFFICTKPIVS
jgi:SAM-dependent methyltransferase